MDTVFHEIARMKRFLISAFLCAVFLSIAPTRAAHAVTIPPQVGRILREIRKLAPLALELIDQRKIRQLEVELEKLAKLTGDQHRDLARESRGIQSRLQEFERAHEQMLGRLDLDETQLNKLLAMFRRDEQHFDRLLAELNENRSKSDAIDRRMVEQLEMLRSELSDTLRKLDDELNDRFGELDHRIGELDDRIGEQADRITELKTQAAKTQKSIDESQTRFSDRFDQNERRIRELQEQIKQLQIESRPSARGQCPNQQDNAILSLKSATRLGNHVVIEFETSAGSNALLEIVLCDNSGQPIGSAWTVPLRTLSNAKVAVSVKGHRSPAYAQARLVDPSTRSEIARSALVEVEPQRLTQRGQWWHY